MRPFQAAVVRGFRNKPASPPEVFRETIRFGLEFARTQAASASWIERGPMMTSNLSSAPNRMRWIARRASNATPRNVGGRTHAARAPAAMSFDFLDADVVDVDLH